MIELHIKFANRQQGAYGKSLLGRTAEWITTTWLRFSCTLFTVIAWAIILSSNLSPNEKFHAFLIAPILAIARWYFLLLCVLLCKYLGTFGKIFAHVLVIYFYLFSRLIVQRSPTVDLGLTR
jgi:hypothetical protein